MKRTAIAIYFDLENVDIKLNLQKLLESITVKMEEDTTPVFVIKLACGNSDSINNFREQLKNLNFDIRDTPHVSVKNLKNRADLILSIEAFESLYQKTPEIDFYVFITSDTDFTVIMDKLRKYGKTVWLVTRKDQKDKPLFTNSCDDILVIEDNFINTSKDKTKIQNILQELGFTKEESLKINSVYDSFEKNKWYDGGLFGTKIRNIIKDFSYKGKKVNSQNKLFERLKEKNLMETKKDGKVDSFKILE